MHQHYSTCDTFYVILNNIRLFRAKICSIHLLPSLTHTNDLCRSLFTLFFLCLNHFRCSSIVSYQLLLQKNYCSFQKKNTYVMQFGLPTLRCYGLWLLVIFVCLFVCYFCALINQQKKIFLFLKKLLQTLTNS